MANSADWAARASLGNRLCRSRAISWWKWLLGYVGFLPILAVHQTRESLTFFPQN